MEGGSIGGRLAGENVGQRSDDVEGGGIGPGVKIPTVDRGGRSDSLLVLSYSSRILYRILQYIELQSKKKR